MTDSWIDFETPEAGPKDSAASLTRERVVQRARNLALVAFAATVIAVWILFNQPAHSYQVGANSTTWSSDVKIALADRPSGGNFAPVGALRVLPGVGKIVEVVVDQRPSSKGAAVYFLTALADDSAGLVYLDGLPPPSDSCNLHLGGPWWELSRLNVATMGCPRGFHSTPGG